MLSKEEIDFIKLAEKNSDVFYMVEQLDLVSSKWEQLPDIKALTDIKFSLFWREGDNTKNTTPRKEITFMELVDIVKSKWLRDLPKIERPYITPYGTFTQRNNESIVHFNSGIIALDYDKLSTDKLKYLKLYWKAQRNTLLSVVSPSGNGLKVILRAKHGFTAETLYNGLKENIHLFTVSGVEPDPMQFVLSQPMFIPYSDEAYFNPYAKMKEYDFQTPQREEIKPIPQNFTLANNDRVNIYFKNRVEYLFNQLENYPRGNGTHGFLYSIVKRIYPYINQQTIYTEEQITQQLESILRNRYGNDSRRSELHRTIKAARYPEESLIDLINESSTIKI